MKTQINVMVFPCGSEIGLEINNALKWCNHIKLFGDSSVTSNHGKYVFCNYTEEVPFVDDHDFLPKLKKYVRNHKIDVIFPAHDSVVTKLAQERDGLDCLVVGSPKETASICRSKFKTYQALADIIKTPKVFAKGDDLSYPVFLKPDAGQGSKDAGAVNSMEELNCKTAKDPSMLILEYLPGREFTIDCFTDRENRLRFVGARERIRIGNGISMDTMTVSDLRLSSMAEKINRAMKFRGAWFFQAKEGADGKPRLLEVAPRIAGTAALHRALGVNLALLSVYDRLDMDVNICPNIYPLELDRALINRYQCGIKYKNVYIDLDETVIFRGKVNPSVILFIYQCINKKISVHLITRHRGNVKSLLKKFRLVNLFDSITQINGLTESKIKFIKGKDSIFIDDSFSERENIKKEFGIPTFEVSAIEGLLDWREWNG